MLADGAMSVPCLGCACASGLLPYTWRRQGVQIQETNQPKANTVTTVLASGLGDGKEEKRNKKLTKLLSKSSRAS